MEKDPGNRQDDMMDSGWEELSNEPNYEERSVIDREYVLDRINKINDVGRKEYAIALLPALINGKGRGGRKLTPAELENSKVVLDEIANFLASGREDPLNKHLEAQLNRALDDGKSEMVLAYSRVCGDAREFEIGNKVSSELRKDEEMSLDKAIAEVLSKGYERELSWTRPNDPDRVRLELQTDYLKCIADGDVSPLEKDLRRSFAEQAEKELESAHPDDIEAQAHRNGINGWIWLNEIDKKVNEYGKDYSRYEKTVEQGKELIS